MQHNNLIDYFFVCGLNYIDGLEFSSITNDFNVFKCKHPLLRSYKASILQKFPEDRKSLPSIDDGCIISLCMPDGLRLFTSSTLIPHPINHNFIITREDGRRIYGISLLFVEEIVNDDIKRAMTDLQCIFRLDHSNANGGLSYCRNCVGIAYEGTDGTSVMMQEELSDSPNHLSYFWSEDDKLYALKAIGVLSQHSYIQCCQSWLYDIWSMATLNNQSRSLIESNLIGDIETYIYNMLFEVKCPELGKAVAIDGPSMRHCCRCPDVNELPAFELPIRGLLEVLGLENFIRVYSCVMLEYRVVIMSQDYRLLMLLAECITTLLFPFVWSHVYAPILPLAARDFLCAPVPFIMGIKLGSNDEEETIELASDASVCYVNIDRQTVTSSDDIPTFPYELDLRREITEIFVHTINSRGDDSSLPNDCTKTMNCNHSEETVNIDAFNLSNVDNSSSLKKCNNKDVLIGVTSSIDGKTRESVSQSSAYSKYLIRSSRLPDEAGISIFDLMQSVANVNDRLTRSEMMAKKYCDILKSNKVFRLLFFNHFLHIFHDYEQFIIPPKENVDQSEYYSESESNILTFDKAGFLSGQPETHLPFLSAFLETQMFTSFIDMNIVCAWEPIHPNLSLFRRNLLKMKHTLKSQLNNSNHDDINFKPYFKSDKLIEDTDEEFNEHFVAMTALLPEIHTKLPLSDNTISMKSDENVVSCRSNTIFPELIGNDLKKEPTEKPVRTYSVNGLHSTSQDLEFNNVKLAHEDNNFFNKTVTLNRLGSQGNGVKKRERFDPRPYLPNFVSGTMSQNHATFVKTLLQESKAKAKRMVLEKMGGQQAVELGHSDRIVSGIEENTLVACLCDLLERMWCHGLIGSHGKSALWTHLMKYVDRDKNSRIVKHTNKDKAKMNKISCETQSRNKLLNDALISLDIDPYCLFRYFNGDSNSNNILSSSRLQNSEAVLNATNQASTPNFIFRVLGSPIDRDTDRFLNCDPKNPGSELGNSENGAVLRDINISAIFGCQGQCLVSDVEAIRSMSDIKTDVGFARAFVRLTLEKKVLSCHLKTLLFDTNLLRDQYNRHAFLRCEDEREKFLFYLFALQSVDYYTFTNLYITSPLMYRMYIQTGKAFSTGNSTTAKAWFCINGQHCSTGVIWIPKDEHQFDFKNNNLGILTTMKIGHDNDGISPSWYIEFVLLQNRITGQIYKFPCNHWLGKRDDDGSTERLLIAELIRTDEYEMNDPYIDPSYMKLKSQITSRSESVDFSRIINRRESSAKTVPTVSDIQEQLGNSVNNLVKYFCRQQDREKITVNSISGSCNVAVLLCGEGGLVCSLDSVFMHGFRAAGFFQKKLFVWDYLEKVVKELEHDLECKGCCIANAGRVKCSVEWSVLVGGQWIVSCQRFCKLMNKISNGNERIGKNGKFQIFVCICVRDHVIAEFIELFRLVDCTKRFYDESSFFIDCHLNEVLVKVLSSLTEYVVTLEPALTDNL